MIHVILAGFANKTKEECLNYHYLFQSFARTCFVPIAQITFNYGLILTFQVSKGKNLVTMKLLINPTKTSRLTFLNFNQICGLALGRVR